jgi:hypothetical protein
MKGLLLAVLGVFFASYGNAVRTTFSNAAVSHIDAIGMFVPDLDTAAAFLKEIGATLIWDCVVGTASVKGFSIGNINLELGGHGYPRIFTGKPVDGTNYGLMNIQLSPTYNLEDTLLKLKTLGVSHTPTLPGEDADKVTHIDYTWNQTLLTGTPDVSPYISICQYFKPYRNNGRMLYPDSPVQFVDLLVNAKNAAATVAFYEKLFDIKSANGVFDIETHFGLYQGQSKVVVRADITDAQRARAAQVIPGLEFVQSKSQSVLVLN